MATKKVFAGYFAKLLRTKTDNHLKISGSTEPICAEGTANAGHIYKKYRCLVCIQPNKRSSLEGKIQTFFSSLSFKFNEAEFCLQKTSRASAINVG